MSNPTDRSNIAAGLRRDAQSIRALMNGLTLAAMPHQANGVSSMSHTRSTGDTGDDTDSIDEETPDDENPPDSSPIDPKDVGMTKGW